MDEHIRCFCEKDAEENFRNKRVQLKEGWRKMHNEELQNLRSSENTAVAKLSEFRWVVKYSTDWGEVYFIQNLVPKFGVRFKLLKK
jgi:hypothetical protein